MNLLIDNSGDIAQTKWRHLLPYEYNLQLYAGVSLVRSATG